MNIKNSMHMFMRIHQLRGWHNYHRLKENVNFHYSQMPILIYIKEHPNCNQQDIANNFALSRAAVTKSLKKICSNGLVVKSISCDDIRKNEINLTKKGIELLESSKAQVDQVDELCFKGFSEEEMTTFDSYLKRIMDNLETDYSRGKSPSELYNEMKGK